MQGIAKGINIYCAVLLVPLVMMACRTEKTTEKSTVKTEVIRKTEKKSYLQFIQEQGKYPEGVSVYIDNEAPFKAKVNKINKLGRETEKNIYAVKSGARHLKVVYKTKILFERNVVLSSQQTRQIHLP
jgi:hypothetical protein